MGGMKNPSNKKKGGKHIFSKHTGNKGLENSHFYIFAKKKIGQYWVKKQGKVQLYDRGLKGFLGGISFLNNI